jgi:hypothetical protein
MSYFAFAHTCERAEPAPSLACQSRSGVILPSSGNPATPSDNGQSLALHILTTRTPHAQQ